MMGVAEPVLIDKKLIGTNRHLLVNGTYSWVDSIPTSAWHLSGQPKTGQKCLDTLAQLNGVTLDTQPSDKYLKPMQLLMSGSTTWPPPWQLTMPQSAHRSFVKTLTEQATGFLKTADKTLYERVWVPGNKLFSSLDRAFIDRPLWRSLLDAGEGNTSALRSFEPNEEGFASPIVYNRFGTKTGRPLVKTGPLILTLKKEHRNIIKSRWGSDGQVVMLDFSALEIRIILYEAGLRCDVTDLYQELNSTLFKGKLPRNVIKEAVICDLYGQSRWALAKRLGIPEKHVDVFMEKIRVYFKTDSLLKRIKQQFIEKGFITNRYGRRVMIDDPLDHVLINAYAQSTGADVVTLGFVEVLERLQTLQAKPIFLLVDAIIIDCHKSALDAVKAIEWIPVDGYMQRFPLKFDEVR